MIALEKIAKNFLAHASGSDFSPNDDSVALPVLIALREKFDNLPFDLEAARIKDGGLKE